MTLKLVIGNKNYSSWSMRPWLAMRASNVAFDEVLIPLYTDDKAEIREAAKRSSQKLAALDLRTKKPEPLFKPTDGMQRHMERKRKLGVINWMRAAWERARPQAQKPKQKERQADHGYGR